MVQFAKYTLGKYDKIKQRDCVDHLEYYPKVYGKLHIVVHINNQTNTGHI